MNEVRVGVRLSGPEGVRVERSLEAAGFVVLRLEGPSAERSRARVVVVEVSGPAEVGAVLREFRSTAAGAPPTVVLVGPADVSASALGAADAFFRRPVPIAELVRVVRRFLAADRASRSAAREGFAADATVRLEKRGESAAGSSPPSRSSSTGLRVHGTSPGERERASARSRLSPALEERLSAADRRLFPDATALPLDLPGAEAHPAELVPDELLASPAPSSAESSRLGGAPASFEAPPEGDVEPAFEPEPAEAAAQEGEMPSSPEPLATTALLDRGPRAASRSPGPESGAALLLTVAARPSPQRVAWRDAEGRSVALVVSGGAAVGFDGPADAETARRLRAEGRSAEEPLVGEEGAYLAEAVRAGLLRPVDVARCRREAIEAIVADFALAPAEGAEVTHAQLAGVEPPLTRPVQAIVLEAVRARSTARLGDAEAFYLRAGARAALASYGLLPEELAALEALVGVPGADLRARPHGVRGLEGLVALLVDLGLAARAPGAAAGVDAPTAASIRVHLANAAARAADGTYFAILGVPRDATAATVERAYHRLRDELGSLELGAIGLAGLERDRARVLEALDEAYVALRSDRLRRAYAAALAAPEGGR